jgi:hypothetical protein
MKELREKLRPFARGEPLHRYNEARGMAEFHSGVKLTGKSLHLAYRKFASKAIMRQSCRSPFGAAGAVDVAEPPDLPT